MNIQSNSQQESSHQLLKDKIRCVCEAHDADKLIADIEETAKLHKLDIGKFSSAILDSMSGKTIGNPYQYIKKVSWSIANERHSELGKSKLPNFVDLHLRFDEIGMTGEEWEKYYIDELITHCLEEFPVSTEEMIKTITSIVDYCVEKGTLTYSHFIKFFLVSKVAKKCNIPLKELEYKTKKELEEIKNVINK